MYFYKYFLAALVAATTTSAMPQFYHAALQPVSLGAPSGHPAPGIVYDESAPNPRHLVHGAVAQNAAAEAQLPAEFMKSARFYNNPQVAAGLARESWFDNKEFPVLNRQADKISRTEIAKIVRRIEHDE